MTTISPGRIVAYVTVATQTDEQEEDVGEEEACDSKSDSFPTPLDRPPEQFYDSAPGAFDASNVATQHASLIQAMGRNRGGPPINEVCRISSSNSRGPR